MAASKNLSRLRRVPLLGTAANLQASHTRLSFPRVSFTVGTFGKYGERSWPATARTLTLPPLEMAPVLREEPGGDVDVPAHQRGDPGAPPWNGTLTNFVPLAISTPSAKNWKDMSGTIASLSVPGFSLASASISLSDLSFSGPSVETIQVVGS